MRKGDVLTLDISDIAFGGDGVGRADGFVVFVPYTAVGDHVRVRVRGRKRNFVTAELVEVCTPGPARVMPQCQYYQLCGGCQYQHLDYAEQLRVKTKQLQDMLTRLGGFTAPLPLRAMLPSPRTLRYRNRIDLHPRADGSYGFCERGQPKVIFALHDCPLFELEQDFSQYPLRRPDQLLVVRTHDGAPYCYFKSDHNEVTSAAFDVDRGAAMGNMRSEYTIGARRFTAAYCGFFQVNRWILPQFVEIVRAMAEPRANDTLLDVYCGVGLFGLSLAPDVARVIGIEHDASCIDCARENARAQGVTAAEFHATTAEEHLVGMVARGEHADVCIVDPPRNGLTNKVVSALKKLRPTRLMYISCGPDTFARDARKLCDSGYTLDALQPLDLFPHTKHFELVARFTAGHHGG
jgi:tRNA/tmRNA/rRNA uracil-C5-methylase (TrmA/RlmC/RlmD family)